MAVSMKFAVAISSGVDMLVADGEGEGVSVKVGTMVFVTITRSFVCAGAGVPSQA
jgi:hypothetical protein